MGVYEMLGVRRVINAWGPMTRIGSARVRPEVVAAMAEAAGAYVDLIDLQRAAGQRLAQRLGVEACYLCGGSAAGLAIVTAACVAGTDRALGARLPDTTGMRREVVIQRSHRNPYDHAIRQVGVQLVEIGNAWVTHDWELEAALGAQTAAVVYVYGHRTMHEPLSLAETVAIAHGHQVPVIVDAAAEVPPAANLQRLSQTGADMVIVSGGKGLRGPQNSALVLLSSQQLLEACLVHGAPNHSLGRSMKITKEDMVGLVTAVELYLALDHDAVAGGWERDVSQIMAAVAEVPGVQAQRDEALYSEGIPVARLIIDPQRAGQSAAAVAAALAEGDPAIRVTQVQDWLSINPQFVEAGEIEQIAQRLTEVLRR